MAMPFHLTVKLGTYLIKQKLRGIKKYPLIMELEPLWACNLKWRSRRSRSAARRWCRWPAVSR
jgi:hypothetical protein